MYIARDKNNDLLAYIEEPRRADEIFFSEGHNMKLDPEEFKDVTWENSPRCIKCCPSLSDQLNYHFDTTPKEELDKEFEELEPLNNVGPTVDEYLGNINYAEVRVSTAVYTMGSIISGKQELPDPETTANKAVEYADALVSRLRKR